MIGIPKGPRRDRAYWFNCTSRSASRSALLILRAPAVAAHAPRAAAARARVAAWQRVAAKVSHVLLYVCMIVHAAVGLSRLVVHQVSASSYFGYTLPHWGWEAPALEGSDEPGSTSTPSYLFVTLIAIHIAARVEAPARRPRRGVPAHVRDFARQGASRTTSGVIDMKHAAGIGRSFLIAMMGLLAVTAGLLPTAPAWAAGLALVGNENGGTISLIDIDEGRGRRRDQDRRQAARHGDPRGAQARLRLRAVRQRAARHRPREARGGEEDRPRRVARGRLHLARTAGSSPPRSS